MKKSLALAALLGLAITSTATASNFSVSGPGGAIPDLTVASTWNGAYNNASFTSTVSVPRNVTSITSVTLGGLTHTWRGDLHIILRDPSGQGHSLVTRPGFTGAGFGDSGDYSAGGNYVIVPSGGGAVNAGAANIFPGTYNQFVNVGAGSWTAAGIDNLPMGSITGAAGTWTLEIRDWAGADVGSMAGGWTLAGTDVSGSTGTPFCEGTTGCPCGNNGSAGNGCATGTNPAGANLSSSGGTLTVTGVNSGATVIFTKGDLSGTAFLYDGLFCMDNFVRFGQTVASAGGVASATDLGSGNYQAWFRDVPVSACGNNANITNGISY